VKLLLWRYRYRFDVAGQAVVVTTRTYATRWDTEVEIGGRIAATTGSSYFAPAGMENQRLAARLADGRELAVTAGYNSWSTVGAVARIGDTIVFESHPGRALALPESAKRVVQASYGENGQVAKMRDNWPSLACDIALGLLFYIVAKLTDLPTAAIVSAVAGLALVVVQRFVKVDLLGGMALFGTVMLLISAAFSIAFQSDWAVMMRSSIVGGISALAFLGDAALGGRTLGPRLARYLPGDLDPRRLMLGMGLGGVGLALVNWGVVAIASKDQWLFYTTFLDTPLAFAFILLTLRYARRDAGSAAINPANRETSAP
jgi:intracellular septation protein A